MYNSEPDDNEEQQKCERNSEEHREPIQEPIEQEPDTVDALAR